MQNAIVAVFVLAAVAFMLFAWRSTHKKGDESSRRAALAATNGMSYIAEMEFVEQSFSGGVFEDYGDYKRGKDIVYGRLDDFVVVTFDYCRTVGSGRSRHDVTHTVTGVRIGGFFPKLTVAREVAGTAVPGDLMTDSVTFNEKFRALCGDRDAAIGFLSPQMINFLLSSADVKSSFWVENGWLFTSKMTVGDEFERAASTAFDYLTSISQMIPAWVQKDFGIDPSGQSDDPRAYLAELFR